MPTNRADDSLFACPFCIEVGYTLDEGDATVFFNYDAFFRHLARHPRPLPNVNGFVVVDGPTMPDHLKNDYDVHLPQPALPHPSIKNADLSVPLPNTVAKGHVRKAFGLRRPPDCTPALEMITGGRIARITWPTEYLGQWCLGWHDGVQGIIPFDAIRLELPPVNQIRIAGTSNICATARWPFSYKDKENKAKWLRFKKGDTITNIGCKSKVTLGARQGAVLTYSQRRVVSGALVLVWHQQQRRDWLLRPGFRRLEHGTGVDVYRQ